MGNTRQIAALREHGVRLVAPETVSVGPEVIPARIAAGVEIHPGCRLNGSALAIGPDCVLGEEGPVAIRDCQLGARVRLRGGFFDRATLLDDVDAGSCAHVRPGTLLEECSAEFRDWFNRADLIIAKGQGNYETLSNTTKDLFFLLTVKCPLIAADIGAAVGTLVVKRGKESEDA